MLPCRLANKLPAKTEDRTQTAECEPPVLLEAAIYSRHTSLLAMRPVLLNFCIESAQKQPKTDNFVKNRDGYARHGGFWAIFPAISLNKPGQCRIIDS